MSAPTFQEFREGSGLFRGVVPDHMSFLVPMELVDGDRWKDLQKKGVLTTTQIGGHYLAIGLHAEGMVPWIPLLASFGSALAVVGARGIFTSAVWIHLRSIFHPAWNWYNPSCQRAFIAFLSHFKIKWYRMEIAFDLRPGTNPFSIRDEAFATNWRGTIYVPPIIRTFRTVKSDSGDRRESKGRKESLMAIYDRGRKIGQGSFTRLEVRLYSRHLRNFPLEQLYLPFWAWVHVNGERIVRLVHRAAPSGTLNFDPEALRNANPWAAALLRDAGW